MADLPAAILNRLANYLRGAGAPTAITAVYLEVFNGDPQGAGSSTQNALTGSANRINVTSALGAASAGVSTNASQIAVTASASSNTTVTHLALYDAVSGGNLLASKALASGTQTITAGNPFNIPASGLSVGAA